nr:unnamed protein product [Callosobruchus chinensis]
MSDRFSYTVRKRGRLRRLLSTVLKHSKCGLSDGCLKYRGWNTSETMMCSGWLD